MSTKKKIYIREISNPRQVKQVVKGELNQK